MPRLFNATMRVKEWQGEVVFLHEVIAGAADRSYGIQVAKLAGLTAAVIERAKAVLAKLEAEDRASPRGLRGSSAFCRRAAAAAAIRPARCGAATRVMAALATLNPDDMSPREALEALYAAQGEKRNNGKVQPSASRCMPAGVPSGHAAALLQAQS